MNNLPRLDLNLLLVFHAIMREGSLTRAGERISLSQPAVSAALGRLRSLLGDPLFVRHGQGMVPTLRAQELLGPVESALNTLRQALHTETIFDPAASERTFRIAMSDRDTGALLPRLIARVASTAPGVCLSTQASGSGKEVTSGLQLGATDVAVGHWPDLTADCNIRTERLFAETTVCIRRAGSSARTRNIRLEEYAKASHVVSGEQSAVSEAIDRQLAAHGLVRRVTARVTHDLALQAVVMQTDCIATIPASFATALSACQPIQILPLPLALTAWDVGVYWHHRVRKDAGVSWLVGLLQDELGRPNVLAAAPLQQKAAGHSPRPGLLSPVISSQGRSSRRSPSSVELLA